MSVKRFVFVFKPSNKGISIPAHQAAELIKNNVIEVDKSRNSFKNNNCFFIYAKDPDFNILRNKYSILC